MYTRSVFTVAACVLLSLTPSWCKAYYQDGDRGPLTTCGSILSEPYGVIQTPNFPHQFPIPIRCRWILHNPKVNGSISIYFTQQFTTVGLTFTEYLYYDDTYKTGERKAHVITDDNITRVKWLQVSSPFLVIELTLNHIEGTQLRALGLLDVFGFNVTYMMRPDMGSNLLHSKACSVIECRLLGHCYAQEDFQDFFCSCFPGFSGKDCGIGPLCTENRCQNGGLCRHMGQSAVMCLCQPGFTGAFCESDIHPPECGVAECGCSDSTCECHPRENDVHLARYETVLFVIDEPAKNISDVIVGQITNYLKLSNVSLDGSVELLNISKSETSISSVGKATHEVTLRIWAARKEAGNLRTVLARLAVRGRIGAFKLLPAPLHFDMYPALALQALSANQKTDVWEGAEFILTCVAYGSSATTFTWYKDGVQVHFNRTTRDIWTRTVAEDALGRRMSVLGVGYAAKPDMGIWSCAAKDANRQRCRAIRMTILMPPTIRLTPASVTVSKGENVSITCLATLNGKMYDPLGFSWSRGGSLLPLVPGHAMWEDLYPAGSVLKLYNVQKSFSYQCQVSTASGRRSADADVWVASGPTCPPTTQSGARWPRSAPATKATVECPRGLLGAANRHCEPRPESGEVEWMIPDFSDCLSEALTAIFDEFKYISFGYSDKRLDEIATQYTHALRMQPSLPGLGTKPLSHCMQMLQYAETTLSDHKDRKRAMKPLLRILDHLLVHRDSFLDEQKIFETQSSIISTAKLVPNVTVTADQFALKTATLTASYPVKIEFNVINMTSKPWVFTRVDFDPYLLEGDENVSIVAVHYTSLERNLPSLRKTTQIMKDTEVEYELVSHHTQVSLSGAVYGTKSIPIKIYYQHINNKSDEVSRYACGHRSSTAPSSWNIKFCEVYSSHDNRIICICQRGGHFGLLKMAHPYAWDSWSGWRSATWYSSILLTICGFIAAISLGAASQSARAPVALILPRAAAALATPAAAATLAYIAEWTESENRNVIEWTDAAFWLICGAAIAAQPLILHAELIGRTNALVPIFAVLSGVSILTLLCASIAGATAAWSRAGVGSLLLAILAASLAVSAALRLNAIAKKTQPDRRFYVKNRMRIVQHTIIMLVSCGFLQVSTYIYALPNSNDTTAILFTSSCVVTSIAIIICYVVRDIDVMVALRNLAMLNCYPSDWDYGSDHGHTAMNLFVKHPSENELRGCSQQAPPVPSYWRAGTLESPTHQVQRRQSVPDSRADIVRCVEFKDATTDDSNQDLYHAITPPKSLCDLIPGENSKDYSICVPLNVKHDCDPVELVSYDKEFDSIDNCQLCVRSTPEIPKIISPPAMKSCLKKPNPEPTRLMSEIDSFDRAMTDLDQVNMEWNMKYREEENADQVLHKISDDLDFLLNRTSEAPVQDCDNV